MTDKQLIRFATEFRAGILGDRSSRMMCAAVCWPLASLLSLHGVKAAAVESDHPRMLRLAPLTGKCLLHGGDNQEREG